MTTQTKNRARIFNPFVADGSTDFDLREGQVAQAVQPLTEMKNVDGNHLKAVEDLFKKPTKYGRLALLIDKGDYFAYAWCRVFNEGDEIPPIRTIEGKIISRQIRP